MKLPATPSLPIGGEATGLGDWSLTIVHSRPAHLVIAISETTRWAFALAAAPLATLRERFAPALLQELVALGVPVDRARAAVDAPGPPHWAAGHERGVLTQLNACAADVLWASNDGLSLPSINRRLAGRLILKPQTGRPAEEVLKLLGGDASRLCEESRAKGRMWKETFEEMQAQTGAPLVRMQVARLLDSVRLEARHEAEVLLLRLPTMPDSSYVPGPSPRWVPHELVIDLEGIDAVSSVFAQALLDQAHAIGIARLQFVNANTEVAKLLEQLA
ncbi:hypothetical protein [Variovorax sp. WS11]|nr:hypothetical protein [Variovorax sp. WS11]NDZ16147.1 hypothetical protein [Variovorax sp. WS11]